MESISRRVWSLGAKGGRGRSVRVAIAGVVLAGAALLVVAGPAAAGDIDAGSLWKKNCQSCHGADGKGKTKAGEKAGVKDLTSAEVKADLTKAKAVDTIKNGVKQKDSDKLAMKAFGTKLSEAEISALADHALSFK